MLKKSYEFFIVFGKSMLDEKLSLAWSLFLPLILFFSINHDWFQEKPDASVAVYFFSSFWAFTTVLVLFNGVGLRVTDFRESGLLKSFLFLCGSKTPIILGLVLCQIVFGVFSLVLFTTVIALSFAYPVFLFNLTVLCTYLLVLIPLFLLSLSIASLPVRASSAYTLVNILIFPATYLAVFRGKSENFLADFLFHLNPVEYVFSFSVFVYSVLSNQIELNNSHLSLLLISVLYIGIGCLAWSKIKVTSTIQRT